MTPEEKLLALIQQDKRQGGSVTPQEKLLALIEQDKQRKPDDVQAQPVVVTVPVAVPVPVSVATQAVPVVPGVANPVPAAPIVEPKSAVVTTMTVPGEAPVPPPSPMSKVQPAAAVKPLPVVVEASQTKSVPTTAAPPVEAKKAPLVVLPPSPVSGAPKPLDPVRQPKPAVTIRETVAQPSVPPTSPQQGAGTTRVPAVPVASQSLLFPTVRVSGVTITNRVLAVVVIFLIVVVFYSVAETQHGIDAEIRRQMDGAGEMAVTPLALSEEAVPSVDFFLNVAGQRNFCVPKMVEKGKDSVENPATLGVAKDLKLVAVSIDPATATESMGIIKNKADSKTYFVKIGESVGESGFVLIKVLADRLILKQGKQEFELR